MDGLELGFIIFHSQCFDVFVRALIEINGMRRIFVGIAKAFDSPSLKSQMCRCGGGLFNCRPLLKPRASVKCIVCLAAQRPNYVQKAQNEC